MGCPLVQLCPKQLGGAEGAVPKAPSLVLLVSRVLVEVGFLCLKNQAFVHGP
jgi:hypothetical protein